MLCSLDIIINSHMAINNGHYLGRNSQNKIDYIGPGEK